MKVLLIHRYFWPEEISTLPVMLRDLVNLHAEREDDVVVVTGNRNGYLEVWNNEFAENVQINCFTADLDRNSSYAMRIWNMCRLLVLAIRSIYSVKPDLIYTVTYPPGLASALILATRLISRKTRVVFYVQDILTYRISNIVLRFVYVKLFAYACRTSHRVITLTDDMREEIYSMVGITSGVSNTVLDDKVCVIPNYSPDLYTSDFRNEKKQFDIIYAGNHGEAQNLDHFLRVLARLPKSKPPVVVFFGEGTHKRRLVELAEELDVAVQFNPSVSRSEVSERISVSAFGLVGAVPDLMRYAFPSKLAAYNAVGVPGIVMCNSESGTADWLSEMGVGTCLDPVDITVAAKQLETALESKSHYDSVVVHRTAQKIYSLDAYRHTFTKEILDSL